MLEKKFSASSAWKEFKLNACLEKRVLSQTLLYVRLGLMSELGE